MSEYKTIEEQSDFFFKMEKDEKGQIIFRR